MSNSSTGFIMFHRVSIFFCYQECISINQSHVNGLLLYGVVCAMQERIQAAETFFEAATNVDPHSVIAWTMLSLFYDGTENDIGRWP